MLRQGFAGIGGGVGLRLPAPVVRVTQIPAAVHDREYKHGAVCGLIDDPVALKHDFPDVVPIGFRDASSQIRKFMKRGGSTG